MDNPKFKIFLLLVFASLELTAQSLQTKFAKDGIEVLSFRGMSLINLSRQQGSALTAEEFKQIDKKGNIIHGMSQLVKGSMDVKTGVYSGIYNWGTLECSYRPVKDTLKINLKITNTSSDTLCGVNVFPLHLNFPKRPAQWQPYYIYYHNNIGAPTIITANYGEGKLSYCNENIKDPVFVGMIDKRSLNGRDYKVWISAIPVADISQLAPVIEKKLARGKSVTYSVSVRFGAASVDEHSLVHDLLIKYRQAFPPVIKWVDRRPIGSLFLSSFENKSSKNNPRGWLPNEQVDVVSVKGRLDFQKRLMSYVDRSISILKSMNAQGMITWDIEGQEFPHDLSYIGSPEKMGDLAPEMEAVADEYFKKFRDAGLRVGICIRPDTVLVSLDKKNLARRRGNEYGHLARKIAYARRRWGCTLFYIDSNGDPNFPTNPEVFKKINKLYPDVLLIPEHQSAQYFAYSAPYEEWRQGIDAVPRLIKKIYYDAFMVLNVAEGISASKELSASRLKLDNAVNEGDILLFRAWYQDDPVNNTVKEVYKKKSSKK